MKRKLLLVLILFFSLGVFSACGSKTGPETGKDEFTVTDTPDKGSQTDNTADAQKVDDTAKTPDTQNTDDTADTKPTAAPTPPTPTAAPTPTEAPDLSNLVNEINTELPGAADAAKSPEGIWTGMTATEIVAQMGTGFNLGNSLDATAGKNGANIYSQETSWGNPRVTREQIQAIADVGFKTIRIPITWMNHIDKSNSCKIDDAWLARVKEIVDYAYDSGLVVIINAHHEDWINKKDLASNYAPTAEELTALWIQISDYFADYDQHLIFEVMNEPRAAGTSYEWTGSTAAYKVINILNEVAVNAIRSSHKGYNDERAIMLPDYAAQSSTTCMMWWELPKVGGEDATNIIASIHGYTPYDFCLQDKQVEFDLDNKAHTKDIDGMFAAIYKQFVAKGIPVVLGETGATNTKDNLAARENWAWYISMKGAEYGIPVVLWDNGSRGKSGGECHAYLNRNKPGEWFYPSIIENFIGGAAGAEWKGIDRTGAANADSAKKKSTDEATVAVIWSNAEGLKSTSEWNKDYIENHSDVSYYPEGGEVLVVYTGTGDAMLMLDSEVMQVWWMPMNAEWVEQAGDKKIAHFSVAGIKDLLSSYGVENVADLRSICVMAANGSITTYEVKAVK